MISILILGGDPLSRASLRAMLAPEPDFLLLSDDDAENVIAGESHGGSALVVIQEGTGLADEMLAEHRVLALVSGDEAAREVLAAGAGGLLDRSGLEGPALAAAIRAVAEGLLVIDPAYGAIVDTRGPVAPSTASDLIDPLTPREMEVLNLLAEGLSNRAIGARLGMSEHTAKFHVNAILGKLDASTRTEAVVRATRLGLLAL